MTVGRNLSARLFATLIALTVCGMAGNLSGALADEPIDVTGRERIVDGLIPVTGAEENIPRLNLRIGFELNSAKLTPKGQRQLAELAAALSTDRLAEIRVGLNGHTDASGPADYNMRLSKRRAEAARQYLVDRLGVDPARLEAAGYGERRLRSDLPADAAGQRRVEVVNLTPDLVRPSRSVEATDEERTSTTDGEERETGGASAVTQ